MEATLDYAETHFTQLLRLVAKGEEVVLREGATPVAKIVPIAVPTIIRRPNVGEVTSAPVRYTEDSFVALDEQGMKDLGLL